MRVRLRRSWYSIFEVRGQTRRKGDKATCEEDELLLGGNGKLCKFKEMKQAFGATYRGGHYVKLSLDVIEQPVA